MDAHTAGLLDVIVTSLLPIILSLALHEWGHAAMAVALGDETPREQGRLTLNPVAHMEVLGTIILPLALALSGMPVFGWAKPVQYSPRRFTRHIKMSTGIMLTAAAGPAMNLFIAIGAALLVAGAAHFGMPFSRAGLELLERIEFINVLLFLFNLLPVPPLDGSRVLFGLVPGPFRASLAQMERFSGLFLAVVLIVGGRFVFGPSLQLAFGIEHFARAVFP